MQSDPKEIKDTSKKPKPTQEEALKKIEIKNNEKVYLERVFSRLVALEEEPSSDDNSKEKKYKKKIEEQVKKKKMKPPRNNFESKLAKNEREKKKFKEEEEMPKDNNNFDQEDEEQKARKGKFGSKALRKIMRKLTGSFSKEEIKLMIWEVDSNLDTYVNFDEYEKMYKRCIIDDKEHEPKKLYYLIQFLMFDKENKDYITIEDTLEVLCVRNTNGIDAAINEIFDVESKDDKGTISKTGEKKETLTFYEFAERMHSLSLRKRTILMNKKKIFCEKIKQDVIAGKADYNA